MKAELELKIGHENGSWVVGDGEISASGSTLDELDENLRQALAASGQYGAGSTVRVLMRLSMKSIPLWMHQFNPSPDYFSRSVTIQL